ncbi:DgyrCDS3623 [Dimorphilus gyrociliatus]|uniref:DgyrCDS3623 n=1 Tax=Dimorphilus gyrociliatus TaxID=2664684 RepID=A0A7I8VFN5_9ANNE|nr:DgyrCDS3623 [Dimorphilus gyrociliatus]
MLIVASLTLLLYIVTVKCLNVSNYDDYTDYVISDMVYDDLKNLSFRDTDIDERHGEKRMIDPSHQSGDGGVTEILFGTSVKPEMEKLVEKDIFKTYFGSIGRALITGSELDSVEFVYEPIEFVREHSRRKSKRKGKKSKIRFSREGLAEDSLPSKSDSSYIVSFKEKDMNNLHIHKAYSEQNGQRRPSHAYIEIPNRKKRKRKRNHDKKHHDKAIDLSHLKKITTVHSLDSNKYERNNNRATSEKYKYFKDKIGNMAICKFDIHASCKDSANRMTRLYCVPLKNILNCKSIAECSLDTNPKIPGIIIHCIREIERRGLNEENIYESFAIEKDINFILKLLMKGEYFNLTEVNIHLVANLLKGLSKWTETADETKKLIEKLPTPNKDTLAYIILHLKRLMIPNPGETDETFAQIFSELLFTYPSSYERDHVVTLEYPSLATSVLVMLNIDKSFWNNMLSVPDGYKGPIKFYDCEEQSPLTNTEGTSNT